MIALTISLALFSIHIFGLVFAIRAARHAHTAQGAVAWAIALIAMPYLSVPAYLLIGPPRPGELEDDQAKLRAIAYAHLFTRHIPPEMIAPVGDRWHILEALAPSPVLYSAPPRLLIDGEEIFTAIFALIDAAEHDLVVQFFIFRDDGLGRRLHTALCRRAREGIVVRVLYDGIGARGVPEAYWQGLRDAGVSVQSFHLRRGILPRVMRINYRNHRKLVAADGQRAIVGGPNVGDEYLGRDPRFGDWRDTALEIAGPAAQVAQATFVVDWLWAGGDEDAVRREPFDPQERGREATVPVHLLPTGPADALPACSLALMHLITTAQRRLWLTTPYFVPDLDVLSALKLAALRGVDVRVLIPDRPDHTIVWIAGFAYAEEIQRAGVKLLRYRAGFTHQKVILVDDDVAVVGTVNFDNRSLHLNFENTVVVFDKTFAESVEKMLEKDFAKSTENGLESLHGYSRVVRYLAPATRLLAPLL
ncbi:MAG: cardiolipin synthase [Acuticoccus sp.]